MTGNHERPIPDELAYTRRDFLILGGIGVVGGAALVSGVATAVNYAVSDSHNGAQHGASEKQYDSSDHTHYPDRLSKLTAEGIEKNWKHVALFPGMFKASPGAKFYSGVDLKEEVDLGLKGGERALILRPVFPGETFRLGTGVNYEGDDKKAIDAGGIDSDTFAFMSPKTGGVVFGNYQQSIENLDLLTRLHGGALAYTSQTNSNLPIQYIEVAGHKTDPDSKLVMPVGISNIGSINKYKPGDPNNPDGYPEVIGYQRVTDYFAIAQGRTYNSEQTDWYTSSYDSLGDPIEVKSGYGPVKPVPKDDSSNPLDN